MAVGGLVRLVAPLLRDKLAEPPVVAVDDAGRWAISLLGMHRGGNAMARLVAGLIGAQPVVTTGTDAVGRPSVEEVAEMYGAEPTREAVLKGNAAIVNGERIAVALIGVDGPDAPYPTYRLSSIAEAEKLVNEGFVVLVVSRGERGT
jgi:cobalamin biosynthesis protein CbiG